jgi:hypothetical protein
MTRWQFFLKADRERDLSTVASGTAWAFEVLRSLGYITDDRRITPGDNAVSLKAIWGLVLQMHSDTDADREWKRKWWAPSVNSLRSVAARFEKFRGRRAEIDPLEADRIARGYLALARPMLQVGPKPMREMRIKLIPEMPRDANGVQVMANFATAAIVLFQSLFCSMVPTNAEHLCQDCFRELPETNSGKTSRAKRCKRCAYKAWWNSKSDKERKEIQNTKMRKYREN